MNTEDVSKDSQGRLHGRVEEHYLNGKIKYRLNFCHGKLHGAWEAYHRSGTIAIRRSYHYEEPSGIWARYSASGKPFSEEYYLNVK